MNEKKETFLALLNRSWRPLTGVGMGTSILLLPWVLLYIDYTIMITLIEHKSDIDYKSILDSKDFMVYVGLYGSLCAAFTALAAIRQFDKNKIADHTHERNSLGDDCVRRTRDDYNGGVGYRKRDYPEMGGHYGIPTNRESRREIDEHYQDANHLEPSVTSYTDDSDYERELLEAKLRSRR